MLVQEQLQQIGTIAKESGIPIKTIRYYEEVGLIRASSRTEGGFRLFNADIIERLHFIKRSQSLGLSLTEIREFLDVHDRGNLPCQHIKAKLLDKLAAIEEQIQHLLVLKSELEEIISDWEKVPEQTENKICPIIERN
ncbi:heavy metal-responsive transcriptional regulator [Calothrix sp. UHCC 0171]|uniref:heavy metal-responsive transcriptional regulator n=1 Tax=Calothrix sp. UHCC 0171 TaxID=3110245 RepID=UPI002B1EBC7B|nr:heavy metal-responsive transcriptional regulator [Calothrix sp. UHCC 0171]MEA5572509.1 heavy metal-responsive transcriptional regulator [Calothrix sp. UHCC 0171]